MEERLRNELRNVLLDRFGLDVNDAEFHYSTMNYAFVFERSMIRVGMKDIRTRQEIVSELMWVDDLKQFKQTVCEPDCSLKGNLLEEFVIDGVKYSASLFRTARGKVKRPEEMTPMFFICVGDLMGTIHKVSTEEREMGMHYKRQEMPEILERIEKISFPNLKPEEQQRIREITDRVNALPKEVGRYGLCHGDFHTGNFFVEENNIWLFDFDSCFYAYYTYDAAAFIVACLMNNYMPGKDRRKTMEEDILPYLKIGYELNKKCDNGYWDSLELMITCRIAIAYMGLSGVISISMSEEIERARKFFGALVMSDSPLDSMTRLMSMRT